MRPLQTDLAKSVSTRVASRGSIPTRKQLSLQLRNATADEKLSPFVELERQVLTVAFYLESIHASERDCLRYGGCGLGRFRRCCLRRSAFTHNILIVLLRNRFLADM
jgi:hypothetical protein